jgi:hypothetical protein
MRASGSVLAVSLLLACGDADGAAEAGSSTQPADTGTPPADPGTDAPPADTGSSTPTTGTDESTSTTSTNSTSTSEVTTGAPAELQRPRDLAVAYLRGQHWDLATHDEYSAEYLLGFEKQRFDHAFVRGGAPCSDCGADYGTADLAFASALGGYDDHPRADAGEGLDHRQLLVDLRFLP